MDVQSSALAAGAAGPSRSVRRIQPSRGFAHVDFAELWSYRELLFYLVWRDVKARYKQTFLGSAWAIFRPIISMVLFSVIFGGIAGIHSGSSIPYPLFVFGGLIGWMFFVSALSGAASGILNNGSLISKAYFPRLYAPLAASAAPLVDFALSLVVMVGLFGWYRIVPQWQLVLLPAFVLLTAAIAVGLGLWLAGATVKYRDVPFVLPFLTQLWMYATPVIYPVSLVPERWRWLLALNPLTAAVDGFRWTLLRSHAPTPLSLAVGVPLSLLLLVTGVLYFRKTERTLADMM
jgi:lipopolysaccharide transport system permease protein